MNKAHPDPEGVLRHVAAMDPPGRRTISTAEAQAVLDELAALRAVAAEHEADLLTVEGQRHDLAERLFAQDAELAALRAVAVAAQKVSFHGELGDLHRLWEAVTALNAPPAAPTGTGGDGGEIDRADCDHCEGTGFDPVAREDANEPSLCEDCDGLGRVRVVMGRRRTAAR